jgi:hypothetical protein
VSASASSSGETADLRPVVGGDGLVLPGADIGAAVARRTTTFLAGLAKKAALDSSRAPRPRRLFGDGSDIERGPAVPERARLERERDELGSGLIWGEHAQARRGHRAAG